MAMYKHSTPMACRLLEMVIISTVSVGLNLLSFSTRRSRNSRKGRKSMPCGSRGSSQVGRIDRRSTRLMGAKTKFWTLSKGVNDEGGNDSDC